MITHYVEKPGYWIYDKSTRTLIHSDNFSQSSNIKATDWIYVDAPGTIRIKNDKIVDFIPYIKDFGDIEKSELKCWTHKPKEYIGFTEKYFYCSICGTKLK